MKKIFSLCSVLVVSFLLIPTTLLAQDSSTVTSGFNSLKTMVESITTGLITALATLFMSLAMLAFFYGIVEFIWAQRSGVEKDVTKGKEFMKWSVVALFVMFSIYGIIKLGQSVICGSGGCSSTIDIPSIKFKTGSTTGGGGNNNSSPTPAPVYTGGGGNNVTPNSSVVNDCMEVSNSVQCNASKNISGLTCVWHNNESYCADE
ncbi:MAG: hypothetical protein KBC41_00205 [Candidatus Pacebacteria bacterium]|nr:hypothetical protein [Candidatus Paceibacterota bacterium]MBP9866489.1 hypothetical protein [Candidatus Paceibacterota bacterium]